MDARAWAHGFFGWYNQEHHHTKLGLLTLAVVHHGKAEWVFQKRQQVLALVYAAHPERFVKGAPKRRRNYPLRSGSIRLNLPVGRSCHFGRF